MKMLGLVTTILAAVVLSVHANAQQTVDVVSSKVTDTIELEGVVEAIQQSTVSAQTSGSIVELPVDVDDPVAAGELIVRLDDTEQRARLNGAQANLESARATVADAERRYRRISNLFEQQVASQAELDQASTQLETSKARASEASAALAKARKQLSYTRVEAPYAGIVTERFVELGESVQPGQALMSGLSLEQLRVVTELPQSYAQYVRERQQAQIETAAGNALTIGSMTFYPYADERSHTFRLRLNLTNSDGSLFPGMLVKVNVAVGEREVVQIPLSAVLERGELRAVYVRTEAGENQLRQVRTGDKIADKVEILSGLEIGEQVVTRAEGLLND